MKFIDLSTNDKITGERIKIAVSVISIILICTLATVGVVNVMEAQSRANREARASRLESMLADTSSADTTTTTTIADTSDTDANLTSTTTDGIGEPPFESENETTGTTDGSTTETIDQTSDTDTSSEQTTGTTSQTEATETTTVATTTTAETTAGITETPMYAEVYAASEVNLRTGPGTEYDLVRTLKAGDKIDVIASTSNGWYKTYNGNYILQSLTTTTPPQTTAATATTAATTAATTTTAAPTEATTTTTAASNPSGQSIDGMTYYGTCHITFYGPQPLGDGTYSTSTATGTTCSEVRTVAADWSIFPAGTTIYIANDPLGGDGYYTVEDRGSGVNGAHIDIYADDGESRSTTSADVYIVN